MDSLDDLPVDEDIEVDEDKQDQLRQLVGAPADAGNKKSNWLDGTKWKIIGCVAVLFALLINPFSQSLFEKLPYIGGSKWSILGFTLTVFTIATILVVMLM